MSPLLRVLYLHDGHAAVPQVFEELVRGGFQPHIHPVSSPEQLRAALHENWDVVLAWQDCAAIPPDDALRLLREKQLDIPLIVVDGDGSETDIQEVLRAGAVDVLGAGEFSRLAVTVAREMRAAQGRRERRSLEERYRHAQKLEAVGRLAGGVAHDFNNLLTIISGYSELLLADESLADEHRLALEEIRRAAQRGGSLAHSLLAFSRRQPLAARVVHMNGMLMSMDKILRRLIGEDIELVVLPAAVHDQVKTDAGQLEQVIMNLAVNARDAMPRGGKLTIEVADQLVENTCALNLKQGRYVVLSISDTGVGMDAETQSHIFEPFFTTKPPGKGTGLGLATAYGIVTQSGGGISVDTAPGQGTTVTIHLPVCTADAECPSDDEVPCCAAVGSETLLLVEDEPRLRKLVRDLLTDRGYEVLEAARGEEALRIARNYSGRIHLVILDVVMPELSGPEVGKRLAVLRPDTRVLYMSGYLDEALVHHGVMSSGAAFLQKPFLPQALAAKVREVLDGHDENAFAAGGSGC